MFIGHLAVGLAAKKATPRVSLGVWFLSVEFLDLLWPTLLLLGIEHVRIDPGNTVVTPFDFYDYPISHSLLMVCLWGLLFAAVVFAWLRDRRASLLLGAGVVSHWVLDWVSHGPDMPLWPGGPKYGLGLWNNLTATMAVELAMFAVGIAIYIGARRSRGQKPSKPFWALMIFLLVIEFANLFGPPPESVSDVALAGHAQWLLVAWAWWADRMPRRGAVTDQ